MKKLKSYLVMMLLQVGFAGMYVLTIVSFRHGMSSYVFSVYRHVVATLVMAPFALLLERKTRPKLTWRVFLKIAMLAFLEPVLDTNLYNLGMKYTTATFASATLNTIPAITFILALVFRLESANIRKIHSAAKVIGTIITFVGAMVMTFYKGQLVLGLSHTSTSLPYYGSFMVPNAGSAEEKRHWVVGTVMLFASCVAWAAFFILQAMTLKEYPAELSLTALICLMGAGEGVIATLVMEADSSVWKIGFDSRLLAVAYSGVVCSGIAYYVQGVVSRERGPVFVSAFSPLCMIATAFLGSIFLAETLHLGR
ncbi:unnamed protein product [Linum tenue]|uniref:WAT1-related protein n=1 Tax=Linum tenue TaxID=586396 RepID=A0AAV0L1K6_9ROSI|nr:unnamed protein product [Linum tenue]